MALTYLIPCILFLLYIFLFYMYHNVFISYLKANLLLFRALINVHRIHDWFAENRLSKIGGLYGRAPWPSRMAFFVTCDPANVHHIVTQNFQNYPKGDDFIKIFEPFGDGFVNTDGEIWRYHRQKLKLAMSRKVFHAFVAETTQEKIRNALFPFLLKTVDMGVTIDMQDMFSRLISDMSNVITFGTDTGSLSIDLPDVPFVRAVDDTTATMFSRVSSPSSWWKFCRFVGIGQEKKLARALVVMDRFIAEVIERRKQEMIEGNNLACHDLLSSYMSDEDRPIKSTKFLRDIVLSLLLASRDTMTAGLSWFFWTLSQNKQAEEKILHELRSIRHEVTPEGMIMFDHKDLENLVYFKAAFMESLRLHPPIPLNFKTVLKPDQLPSGFTVTPGMKVMVSAYAMGRMQDIWDKDCLEFKPERWISDKGTLTHMPSYRYLVFHTGPRSCLGENMAVAQMRMVAAVMLYNFCFEVAEGRTVEPTLSIVLHMKNGLRMRIRRRVN